MHLAATAPNFHHPETFDPISSGSTVPCLSFPSPQSRLPPIMFNLRTAAVRAAAASARAQSTRAAGPQRISVVATASWASKQSGLAGFSTRSAILESQRPIEPLDATVQPGTAPNPKLESEELLRQAQEQNGNAPRAFQGVASQIVEDSERANIIRERNRSLFVGNAPYTITEADIRADFGSFGEIESVYLGSLKTDGWFTILYSKHEYMQAAVAEAHGSFWHARRITAKPRVSKNPVASAEDGGTVPRRERNAASTETKFLYVGNLPRDMTDAELTGLFSELKNVVGIRVATKPGTNELAGYAHVDFSTLESAIKAKDHLTNLAVKGRNLRVVYNKKFRTKGGRLANAGKAEPYEGTEASPEA